ncbi:MAG TPA: glucokinase, partial [Rectinemataceae bacterium]
MANTSKPRFILACDIGGTNTSLALVEHIQGRFTILRSRRFSTQALPSLLGPIASFIQELKDSRADNLPEVCCVSAAGPVSGGKIQLTNASWAIDAAEIETVFNIKTYLINDFTAISYAVVLLDQDDPGQITPIPHTDGSAPRAGTGMALVIGVGTGMGMGFVDKRADGSYLAYPSEGGHSELPCHDTLSYALHAWVSARQGYEAGAELFLSGQGISNTFSFLCSGDFRPELAIPYGFDASGFAMAPSPAEKAILALPEQDRPAAIAAGRTKETRCALAMEIFADLYARKVSSL